MRVVMARDLGDAPREQMAGARWLVFTASEIPSSTTLLMFTELDDILVAVDHRGSTTAGALAACRPLHSHRW